ncbi:MAG: hypothetical protein ABEK59_02215 [Halobacteria archaeon]
MRKTKSEYNIKGEIQDEILIKLNLHRYLERFEYDGPVWRIVYSISGFYIDHIRKIRICTELISYSLAIYLVNIGFLIQGVIIGVMGIIITDHLNKSEVKISAKIIANTEIKNHQKEAERELNRKITR